jgi:hypothetical protein
MNLKIFFVFIIFQLTISYLNAQKEDVYVGNTLKNIDYNYSEYINSVRFYPDDSEIDYPVIELNGSRKLILEFDDLEADNKQYFYKIIHCNFDWTPSEDISAIDYIDGFQENRFYESSASFNTRIDYTHYNLKIPNDDVKFKFSGNFLLKVYLNDDENDLVLTRRFVVFEPQMKIVPSVRRTATSANARSYQELSCKVEHAGIYISQPATDIKVAVLQNGRWDNAVTDLKPTFVQEEAVIYDLMGMITFPGFKEFRPLDLRTFRHRGQQVETLEQINNGFKIKLFPDYPRELSAYLFTSDLNGKFIIATLDNPAANERGEYALVNFSLKTSQFPKHDIYIFGGLSDFQLYPKFKMAYNAEKEAYEAECLLKNGFYDFYYVAEDKKDEKIDLQLIEGSNFETENDYLFFVYYRKYGGRYDQLVAYSKTSSNKR